MKHSLFGPSSLERRFNCPGSYRMEKDLPSLESKYAQRGTELHALVANMILGELGGDMIEINKDQFNASEIEAIYFCYEQYKNKYYEPLTSYRVEVEKQFNFESVLPMVEIGTTDMVVFEPYKIAHVFDWKFNFNPISEATNSIQLGVYALGAFMEYEATTVFVHLVEAFSKKVTSYQYMADEQQNIIDFVQLTIKNCLKAFAPLRPSKETCQYCRAVLSCPAILDQLFVTDEITPLANLPVTEISKLLDIADLNLIVAGKIKEYAYACMSQGCSIPGWYLKEGLKRRFWKSDVTEKTLQDVGKLLGIEVDGILKQELLTPSELEKKWGKAAMVVNQLKQFIDIKEGEPILKKEKRS